MGVLYAKVNGMWVEVAGAGSGVGVGPTGPTGPTGPAGATGAPSPGIPIGGAVGQIIVKSGGPDYVTAWTTAPVYDRGGVTGMITMTQATYDALGTWDPATMYVIVS